MIIINRKEFDYLKKVYMDREHTDEQSIPISELLGELEGFFEKYKIDTLILYLGIPNGKK
jgi:hypothetical protein